MENQDDARVRLAVLLNIMFPFDWEGLLGPSALVTDQVQVDQRQQEDCRPGSHKASSMGNNCTFDKSPVDA